MLLWTVRWSTQRSCGWIYRADGIFDRPVGELPAQAPSACSRVLRWDELAGRALNLGMLELLEAACTPMIGDRPAVAEL